MNTLLDENVILGILAFIGGAILLLKKLGLGISFKKDSQGTGKCPDPACHATVRHVGDGLNELKSDFKDFKKTMEAVPADIGYIRGYLENKGGNFNE